MTDIYGNQMSESQLPIHIIRYFYKNRVSPFSVQRFVYKKNTHYSLSFDHGVLLKTNLQSMQLSPTFKRSIEKIKGQRKRAAEIEMKLENETHENDDKRQLQISHFLDESHSLREQRAAKQKIKAADFKILKIIGKGAFGEVRIVRHKDSGAVFAMKTKNDDC